MANDKRFQYVAIREAGELASGLVKLHANLCFSTGAGLTREDFTETAQVRAERLRKKYGASEEQVAKFLAATVGEFALLASIAPTGTCTVKVSA